MCTVSFIPAGGKVFITSNRDEHILRPLALTPSREERGPHSFVGPKDALAGGTWIALRDDRSAMVLLNGALEKHRPQPPYRKSRGQIFRDIFVIDDSLAAFGGIDLQGIEPFTLILWQNNELHELRWDGKIKARMEKDKATAHLWSSSTLYKKDVRLYRENFFRQWLALHQQYSVDDIHAFHLHIDPDGCEDHDIRINRISKMLTVSVSCIEIGRPTSTFHYSDLLQIKNHRISL